MLWIAPQSQGWMAPVGWSDCYPRPPGARRADRAAVPSAAMSGQAADEGLGAPARCVLSALRVFLLTCRRALIYAPCLTRMCEPNLPTDPEASRERFATSRRQPRWKVLRPSEHCVARRRKTGSDGTATTLRPPLGDALTNGAANVCFRG